MFIIFIFFIYPFRRWCYNKDFSNKYNWDDNKVFVATTTTTAWKVVISANPYDFVVDITAWLVWLAGYDELSSDIQSISIWNRYKETIEEAYRDESVMDTLDQAASDFLETYNDPEAWVLEKSYGLVQTSLTFWYWWLVAATREWLWITDAWVDMFVDWVNEVPLLKWASDAFFWWIKEIGNWFK